MSWKQMPRLHAVVEERLADRVGLIDQIRRNPAAGAEEQRGLALDDVEVVVDGEIGAAVLLERQDLALDHLDGRRRQQPQHIEIGLGQRHRHRVHEDVVADQDGEVVAPAVVDRRPAAADFGLVDDVVVNQRGVVDELDHRAVGDVAMPFVAQHFRDEQEQRRAEALAAAGEDVVADVLDGLDVRLEIARQLDLDELELRRDEIEEALGARELFDGRAAGWGRRHGAQNNRMVRKPQPR